MMQFTIKTLDSRDHPFTVDDEITVQGLKEKVMEEMGVDISLQRLIFCGRVLQDDKKLAEYGVEGKVIHMVQRAPPSVEAREALRERERERERENAFTDSPIVPPEPIGMGPVHLNNINLQQIRRLMALAVSTPSIQIEELPGQDLSPTASRLEFLRHLVTEITSQVAALKQNGSDEQPIYPDEDPAPPAGTLAEACATNEVMCQIHQRPLVYQIEPPSGSTRQSRGRSIRAMRSSYHTPPADLCEIMEQLQNLDAEFAPFRDLYVRTLRQVNNPHLRLEEEELQRRQRNAELSAGLYHSFSHAYHLVSDIGLLMTHQHSRLTSEALMRTPPPTSINILHSLTPHRASNEASSSSRAEPPARESQVQTQPNNQQTVNFNVQPDPIAYQVEIEARVPIPVSSNSRNHNQGQDQNRPQAQNLNDPSQGQNNQDGQGNRRQVMLDFENLFRGLGHGGTLGGVEVVMSMEEIPQAAAAAMPQQDAASGGPQTQMPWSGGPPTAEFLQNILSSVIRQDLVPGLEGIPHTHLQQLHSPHIQNGSNQPANENHRDHNADAQATPGHPGQGQSPGPTRSNKSGLSQAGTSQAGTSHAGTSKDGSGPQQGGSGQSGDNQANQGQGKGYAGNGAGEGSSEQGGSGQGRSGRRGSGQGGSGQGGSGQGRSGRRGSGQGGSGQGGSGLGRSGRRGAGQDGSGQDSRDQVPDQNDQSQTGKRPDPAQTQEQGNGGSSYPNQEPPRSQSLSLLNVLYDRFLSCDSPRARQQLQRRRDDTLRAGGPRLRDGSTNRIQNYVETLFERFDRNTINDESLMIATFLTLREATSFSSGRTLVPEELLPLRRRLQYYMREIIVPEANSDDEWVESIFARHAAFISRMHRITPIRPSVDLVESMKAVVVRFVNEAITVICIESNETFFRRFRIIYPRMFYELCGVLSYCSLEGVEGLRRIYRSFISDLIQNIDEPVRDLLYNLGMENLNTAICRIETNKVHCAKFIQRKGSSQSDSSESLSESAMDIVDTIYSQSETTEPTFDEVEEFNPYPIETPPAGIVPTTTTLINCFSRSPLTTTPIVPTVTTVPNLSTYQTTTMTHSPIVPTAPIIPTISVISPPPSSPSMDSESIVRTVPMVPRVPISTCPVLLSVPPIVPTTPPISDLPPLPISPEDPEHSEASMDSEPIVGTVPMVPRVPISTCPVLLSVPPIVPTTPTISDLPPLPISPEDPEHSEASMDSEPIVGTVSMVPRVPISTCPVLLSVPPIVPTTPTISDLPPLPISPEDPEHSEASMDSEPIVGTVPMVPRVPISTCPVLLTVPPIVTTAPRISDLPPLPISPEYPEHSEASMDSEPIVGTVPMVPRVPISTCPVLLTVPPIVTTAPRISDLPPLPISPEYPEHSEASSMASNSNQVQSSSAAYQRESSGRRPCPFVEIYDDHWDGDMYRGRRAQYSAPSTSSAPVHDRYESVDESQASTSASTSRYSSSPYEPRGRYNPPRSQRRERSYDSHRGRRNATSTVTSSQPGSYENRQNNASASSSSYRSAHSHHHRYRGSRRRPHRGSIHPGTSFGSRSDIHENPNGHNHYHFNGRHDRHDHGNRHNNPAAPPSPDDDSHLFVAPAQIAQHWGEDWVPTFTRDMQQQRELAEPFSDAYLSGMPPKKRRCVRQSRPPTTLNELMDDSVGEISEQLGSNSELRTTFREHLRGLTRTRATTDEDYEPAQRRATTRFLRQTRSRKRNSVQRTEKQPKSEE